MRHTLPILCCLLPACSARKAASEAALAAQSARSLVVSVSDHADVMVEVDLNGDGRTDVNNYHDQSSTGPLVRRESDLNLDGKMDISSWYENGLLIREDMDGDFDGNIDWRDHYQGGVRMLTEVDTDNNGSFDMLKYYACVEANASPCQAYLKYIERDSTGNDHIDLWVYYRYDGSLEKVGRDVDYDGSLGARQKTRPDYWEIYDGAGNINAGWDADGDGQIDERSHSDAQ